jgi:FKBP-type peptidyl-prolyl cis-trans isomerase SlyD
MRWLVARIGSTYALGVSTSPQRVISFEYTLTDDDGRTVDTSRGRAPLSYLHGAGNIVAGLEKALDGQPIGASFKVSIPPEEGYGVHAPGLIRNVAIRKLPGGKAKVGTRVRLDTSAGPHVFVVKSVKGDYAQLDGNHPLAGKTLHFDVEVVDIRDPTAEEIAHGHVHGAGGHDH